MLYAPDGQDGDVWNGEVVYYAHGYVDPAAPLALHPWSEELSVALLDLGYGFAHSSYKANGFAVKEGIQQTHQLRGLFTAHFGEPARSYIVGHSMGGLITMALAEKYPNQYDGALPMCGIVGGGLMAWDPVINTRALFDYYYPGVLPGDAVNIPEGLDFSSVVVPAALGAIFTDPTGALEIGGTDQLYIAYADIGELIDTIITRFYFHTVGVPEGRDRAQNHSWFDNRQVYYTGSSDDAALNAGVDRFEATTDAVNYFDHNYEPTGGLMVPMVTLHTTRDPIVPIVHEEVYESIVTAAGSGDLLVRQHVVRYGHCTFTLAETMGAFLDLVHWVEDGVKPAGGDVTQP